MSADAVSLKLPSFWTNDVETWFAQAEAQFALRDITNEITKFHHVVSVLSADVACKVSSILRSSPGHNPYTALKKHLTCKYQLTEHYRAPVEAIPVPPRRFTHVHVDIVGPLPTSRGYTYLLTILDRTTRWPEAVPLQDITAAGCARAFITGWVARFGVPLQMTSDRGRQFISSLWSEMARSLGTQLHRTTSYHPQANGMVGRFHRSLKASLRARLQDGNWIDELSWSPDSYKGRSTNLTS